MGKIVRMLQGVMEASTQVAAVAAELTTIPTQKEVMAVRES